MDLQNVLRHMRGKSVVVNGTRYQVDADGVAAGVSGNDASKLLLNQDAWRPYIPPQNKRGVTPKPNLKAEAKPKPVTVEPEVKPEVKPEVEPEAEPEPEVKPGPALELDPEVVEPGVIPGEGQAWPDPKEDMDPDYLRAMADAYGVAYRKNTTTKKLAESIFAAMYD